MLNTNFLDFERPVAELEAKIQELRSVGSDNSLNISDEIAKLEERSRELTQSIFGHLKVSQIVQLARHPERPYLLDYIPLLFTEFDELHGDRYLGKGPSIIGGIARFEGEPVMVIGHQKGRKTQEKMMRNFGMGKPEDYRKALRLMEMAEKFHLPVFTFIDTAGAYPGIEAEEHNQSGAIARNLFVMSKLTVPIICTVVGEGGSGGALGIAVGDRLLMLQYSFYSVISPEGCAAILWKDPKKVCEAGEALGLTAEHLLKLKLIDQIIKEPLGGAHRNVEEMASALRKSLSKHLKELRDLSVNQLLKRRYQRLMAYGLS